MFYKASRMPSVKKEWDSFNIRYRDTKKAPVTISMQDNNIVITAHVKFAPNMYDTFISTVPNSREAALLKMGDNYTFADAALDGIKQHWEKSYTLPGFDEPVKLTINFVRFDDPDAKYEKGQRFFKIRLSRISNTSFVSSSPYRWLWGILFYLSPESVMLNWSPYATGTINMHRYKFLSVYKKTVAHEFGHILGIGDAYGAHYRFYYEVPDTYTYMMNTNVSVHPNEVMMVLNAHKTHRMQYFPMKFSLKTYIGGLKTDFRYYYRTLTKTHKSNN